MIDPDSGLTVLHVDTGRTWRGGQAQIFNLLSHMRTAGIKNHLLLPPDSPLIHRFETSHAHPVIHTHPLRGVWDLTAVLTLRSIVREHGVDLIHAHSSGALGITWIGSEFFSFPPFVETRRLETPVAQNPLSRRKYRSTDHHIANSETVKETLVQCGIDEQKITVIPSGINLEAIEEAEPDWTIIEGLGFERTRPIVGNIGALSPQKDQKTFVRAASRVHEQFPEAQFVIAGEGEERAEIVQFIEEHEASDYCKLAGFVKNIFGFMKTLDLFVLTSLYEGLCGTLLQVMACGVPVVTSNILGSRQIIHDHKNCVAVEPGDVSGFVDAITNFLENPSNYEAFLPKAKTTAIQYDYECLSDRTATLYRRILQSKI